MQRGYWDSKVAYTRLAQSTYLTTNINTSTRNIEREEQLLLVQCLTCTNRADLQLSFTWKVKDPNLHVRTTCPTTQQRSEHFKLRRGARKTCTSYLPPAAPRTRPRFCKGSRVFHDTKKNQSVASSIMYPSGTCPRQPDFTTFAAKGAHNLRRTVWTCPRWTPARELPCWARLAESASRAAPHRQQQHPSSTFRWSCTWPEPHICWCKGWCTHPKQLPSR